MEISLQAFAFYGSLSLNHFIALAPRHNLCSSLLFNPSTLSLDQLAFELLTRLHLLVLIFEAPCLC